MARVPTKHSRDQLQGFEGLLNNLQDWELSLKNKDKKVKSEALGKEKLGEGVKSANELSSVPQTNGRQQVEKLNSSSSAAGQYGYLKNYDSINHLSSRFRTEDSFADANAEKELEAEDDCTEALNLDDRYIKAYSRRSTARKELGKLRESTEDAEFALRLEPQNNEVKKQYAEVKALYEKEILKKVSGSTKKSVQRTQKSAKPEEEMNKSEATVQSVSSSSQRVTEIQGSKRTVSAKPSINIAASPMELDTKESNANPNSSLATAERNRKSDRQELKESVQELAARAASYAKAEAAKNIAPPNSAYQFEVSWRGLSGDRNLQVQLLKVTSPAALPQIFKNALSAPMLMDIARCIATFFMEDEDLAVRYLENLPKVPRFSMIIMCVSSSDKADAVKRDSELASLPF
nr:RNA polymerase II-associated protein 3 isoform X2 [Ipomoea batatas]